MCGITGILNFSNNDHNYFYETIKKINVNLNYRGPDNTGIWYDKKNLCYLGHTRLSIIDLSSRSNQPMIDDSEKFVITFNGEIYNFLELRKTLIKEGINFRTKSDTEVLLLGYKHYGKNFLELIDGMFAFAIYDIDKQSLFIARDRAGEKPLYYILNQKFFAFSSELKPLLNYNKYINFEIDEYSYFELLTLRYVPKENSIVKQIKKIEPGNCLEVSSNGEFINMRYFAYNICPNENANSIDLQNYQVLLKEKLKSSIKARLNSDVPLGTFLSGGIDSSLTSAILAKDFNLNLQTFSIGFEDEVKTEHKVAKTISKYIGSDHNEIIINQSELNRVFQNIGKYMDEPNGDRSMIPTFIVSEFAKRKVTVVLSGDGADELFGGYPRYWMLQNKIVQNKNILSPFNILELYFEYFLPVYRISTLKKIFPHMYNKFIKKFSRHFINEQRSISSSIRNLDFETYLTCVLSKVDMMSMKSSLEVRTPFLNKDIIKFSQSIPENLIWNGKFPKLVLRKICSEYLPLSVCNLPKKGFGLPLNSYNILNINENLFHETNETYKNSNFFSSHLQFRDFIKNNYQNNSNATWLYITFAKWLNSININL